MDRQLVLHSHHRDPQTPHRRQRPAVLARKQGNFQRHGVEKIVYGCVYVAGIWHFATFVDRYTTDGYGAPCSFIEAIDLAGQMKGLSVIDINYPFFGGDFTDAQIKQALDRNKLGIIGTTPEIYNRACA